MRETQRERNSVDVIIFKYSQSKRRAVVVSRSWTPGVVDVKLSSTFARIGLLTLKFSLTFTDFPSNVCVVSMLAFFVYARFFLPTSTTTTRRRLGRQSRPTRVMRFRHAMRDSVRKRDDDHDDEEEERIPKREKREKKGKKNVTRFVVRRERKKRVKAFFSCENKKEKKRDTTTFRKRSIDPNSL